MSEIDVLFGKAGEPVPVVDVADIKVMWAHLQELKAQHPGGGVGCRGGYLETALQSRRRYSSRLVPMPNVGPVGNNAASRLDRRRTQCERLQGRSQDGYALDGGRRRSERENVSPFSVEGFLGEVFAEAQRDFEATP
jgi:hypothetical protein